MIESEILKLIEMIHFAGIGLVIIGLFGLIYTDSTESPSEYQIWIKQVQNVTRYSTDCNELKSVQLELIEKGANSDNWLDPNSKDRALSMAEKRYGVLCE